VITDADGLLTARFAALRDDHDDSDWSEVLTRRGARSTRRTRRLVAALAVVVVAVPSALAFGGVRGFFFGAPAPPLIVNAFRESNAMQKMIVKWEQAHHQKIDVMPQANGRKAHSVIAVDTSDGPLVLWAAPASRGRQCWFVGFANDLIGKRHAAGGGSCDQAGMPKLDWGDEWSRDHPTLKVIDGRLHVPGAVSVTVIASNLKLRVPVVHGFFLAAVPKETKTPTKLVAQDAEGRWLATWTPPR
jgi:hypothetical protein